MKKYIILIVLVAIFFFLELGIGIYANSLSLQTDAFHMLSDLFALIIAYVSYRLAQRKKTTSFTFGWVRAEIIGGFVNSIFLLAISFTMLIEIITKTIELINNNGQNPQLEAQIDWVLIVAGFGLAVNLIGLCLFHAEHEKFHSHHSHGSHSHSHSHPHSKKSKKGKKPTKEKPTQEQNNPPELEKDAQAENTGFHQFSRKPSFKDIEKGDIPDDVSEADLIVSYNDYAVFLHVLGDTLGSLLVIGNSLLVKYVPPGNNWSNLKFYLDPIVSLLILIVIVWSSFKLFRACVLILLHQTPHTIDYDQLTKRIKDVEGVEDIHDVHVWPLDAQVTVATLHLKIHPDNEHPSDLIIGNVKTILHEFNIHSSTIQPEYAEDCLEPHCQTNCSKYYCCEDLKNKGSSNGINSSSNVREI